MKYAIKIENLVKRFGDIKAVDGLSLDIAEGEIFGLLGPNGAGKSTIINILSCLMEPTSGSASVGGYDIMKDPSKIKGLIGVCPQHSAYYKYLTGRENIELPMRIAGLSRSDIKDRTDDLLKAVGLEDRQDHRPDQLSGGEQQRIAFAVAMGNDPDILLADEPTGELDSETGKEIMDIFRALSKQMGKTEVIVTHDKRVSDMADRTLRILDGRFVEEV